MAQGVEFSQLVDRTLDALADVLGTDGAALMLIDDHDRLRAVAGSDDDGRRLELAQERTGSGPAVETLVHGADVVVDDLHAARPLGFPGMAAQVSGVHAVLSVPLRADDRLIGILNFYDRTSHEWQPAKVRAGERLGELMVIVLQTLAHKLLIPGQS
ncbi:GAF domain-containing protein [Streptosporangium sp. CA-135522]|uniref:GAF domain-containing protein n=1 Tax=Streptosporangium sp. CA-135522 TaxID=3240072 RepID=UPI003D8E026E